MQRAVERMQKMINRLLELSRVSTRPGGYEPTALTRLAQEAVSDLTAIIEETGGQVMIDELPVAEVDVAQMRRLFQNLIGNGLKFHQPATAPIVHMRNDHANGNGQPPYVAIRVEDNGIGFEQADAERIFLPFQRLHGVSEYEGTGLGLSICQKIVERRHGRIEVISQPGAGSAFTVILPTRQPDGMKIT